MEGWRCPYLSEVSEELAVLMYTEYFGFREKPFNITPDPQFFYTNPGYQEAYTSLLYGVRERKGVILLSGEVGTGKTTLLYRLKEHFAPPVHCVFLSNPNIAFDELLDYICSEFKLAGEPHGRLQKIQALQAFLMQCLQDGGTGVLLIDEAQDLEDQVLENLRLLSNLETTCEKLLQIVLSGQPELELKLAQPKWRQLRQRIAVKHRLLGLQEQETAAFIYHRLQTVGYEHQDLFPPQVAQRIAVYSKNIPRLINIICDNALLSTYGLNKKTVSVDIIEEVAQDLELTPSPSQYASGDASRQGTPEPVESPPLVTTQQDSSAGAADAAADPDDLGDSPVWQRAPSPAFSRSDVRLPSRRMQIGLGILLGLFVLGGAMLPIRKLTSFFSQPPDTLVALPYPQHVAPTAPQEELSSTSQKIAKASPDSLSGSPPEGSPSRENQENSLFDDAKPAEQTTQTGHAELADRTTGAGEGTPPATAQLSPPQETVPQTTSLVIQKGTTIYDIVLRAYGTYSPLALDLVKEFNPQLQDLSRISVGQLLRLPPQTQESLLRKQQDGSYQLILASFRTAQRARAFSRRVEREGYRTETTQRRVSRDLLLHRVTITDLSNREAAARAWRFVNGLHISG